MIVVFSARAEADLERIGDAIARDNPSRAASFVAELAEAAQNLASMPERFPLVPRYAQAGVRRRPF